MNNQIERFGEIEILMRKQYVYLMKTEGEELFHEIGRSYFNFLEGSGANKARKNCTYVGCVVSSLTVVEGKTVTVQVQRTR